MARSAFFARAVLLAACLVVVLPAAADAQLSYDDLFGFELVDAPVSATSVKLCWAGYHSDRSDSWTIRRAAGTTPPAPDAAPEAVIPTNGPFLVCYTSTGLVTATPYTFRITGHDASGESAPGIITAGARDAGSYVLYGDSSEKLPRTGENDTAQLAVTSRDRRWHVIFTRSLRHDYGTFYSAREPAGWTAPELLTTSSSNSYFASNAGTLAVVWKSIFYRPRYRIRPPGASEFTPRRTIPHRSFGDNPFATALDRRGHLHVLIERGGQYHSLARLLSVSNASGRWREQRLASSSRCEFVDRPPCSVRRPLLTYDPGTDRMVVLQQYKGIKIATKRAAAKKFGAFRAVSAAKKLKLVATGLTSRGDRVTLGLESHVIRARLPIQGSGPLYAMPAGHLVKVPGTSASDSNLLVAASSRDRVLLGWQNASWDPTRQGIWSAEIVRDRNSGRWSIRDMRHRTGSHYDRITSLTATATGQPLIAYTR